MSHNTKTVATRLDVDTVDWLEDRAEDRDETKAEIMRRAVQEHKNRVDVEDDLGYHSRAEQAELVSTDRLTLVVSTLTFLLVAALVVGGV